MTSTMSTTAMAIATAIASESDSTDGSENKRKITRTNYSKGEANEKMKRAMSAYYANDNKFSINEIAYRYSVNKNSLGKRLKNKYKLDAHHGRQNFFTEEEENGISEAILALSDSGKDLNYSQIRTLIEKCLINKQSPVTKVANNFVYRFLKRRPELYKRLTLKRAARTKTCDVKLNKSRSKQSNNLCCKRCEKRGPKSAVWICCSECDQLYHVSCFRNLKDKTIKQIEKMEEWFCYECY